MFGVKRTLNYVFVFLEVFPVWTQWKQSNYPITCRKVQGVHKKRSKSSRQEIVNWKIIGKGDQARTFKFNCWDIEERLGEITPFKFGQKIVGNF